MANDDTRPGVNYGHTQAPRPERSSVTERAYAPPIRMIDPKPAPRKSTGSGTTLADGNYGDVTVGGSGTTMVVNNDAITDAKLRNSAAVSVIGRSANSTGDPADIAAGANDTFLQRVGNALTWAGLTIGMIANNLITLAKIEQIPTASFLGRKTAATGNVEVLTLTDAVNLLGLLHAKDYRGHVNGGGGLEIWYALGWEATDTTSNTAQVINNMSAVPFVAPSRGGTLDRLSYVVTTLAAGNARVGIYDAVSLTNVYPNNLIVDGGGLSTGTTGNKNAVISQALVPGALYWAVYLGDATPTVRTYTTTGLSGILGFANTLSANPSRALTVTQTYGALPGTFPAGAVLSTSAPPAIWARFSA